MYPVNASVSPPIKWIPNLSMGPAPFILPNHAEVSNKFVRNIQRSWPSKTVSNAKASEAATMNFVSAKTDVLLPKFHRIVNSAPRPLWGRDLPYCDGLYRGEKLGLLLAISRRRDAGRRCRPSCCRKLVMTGGSERT